MKANTLFVLLSLFTFLESTATPDTWTQKNDIAYRTNNVTEPPVRYQAASFSIGSKGYLCGGRNGIATLYKDTWSFDSLTGVWTQLANLLGGERMDAVAFAVGSKGYLGTGLDYNGQRSSQFYQYDPATNTWQQKANFGGGVRESAVGFGIGAKGYIGLGDNGTGTALTDFWEYDTLTDAWTPVASFPGGARSNAVAFTINGNGYVVTGSSNNKFLYMYSQAANTWITKASLPSTAPNRSSAMGCAIGGKGYVCGGYNNVLANPMLKDFYEYDPFLNSWTQRTDFPGGRRANGIAFGIGSKGYFGTGAGPSIATLGDMRSYDMNTATWSSSPPFGGVSGSAVNACTVGNYAYVGLGGNCDFRKYTPTSDTWSSAPFMYDTILINGVSFAANGKAYVGLGVIENTYRYRNDIWEFNPVSSTWSQKANFPGAVRASAMAFGIGTNGYVGFGANKQLGSIDHRDFWMYNGVTNTWAARDSFPVPVARGCTFVIGKKGYLTLFRNSNTDYNQTWEFDSETGHWTQKADYPLLWTEGSYAFSAGSKGYAGLGYNRLSLYEYDPLTDMWTPKASNPGPSRNTGISFSINGIGYIGLGRESPGLRSPVLWQYEPDPSILSNDAPDTIICQTASFKVPYEIGGVFDTSNVFTLQMSDSTGDFTHPVDIGATHSALPGTITAAVPNTVPEGSGYLMRVVSSNPVIIGTTVDQKFKVLSSVTPAISLSVSANPACVGATVQFNAITQNGGSLPSYQWKLNGANVGFNTNTYSSSSLATGSKVTCYFTSSFSCAVPSAIYSDTITMTVLTTQPPSVQLSTSADSICAGSNVTYRAIPTNAYMPVYSWYKNGIQVVNNADSFSTTSLQDKDSIWVVVTSASNCNATNTAKSIVKRIKVVSPPILPEVSVTASSSDTICSGTSVLLHANTLNGGSNPVFQWLKNGNPVGTNSLNYTASGLALNDSVWVILTSNALCATGVKDTSSKKVFVVQPVLSPTISIVASQNNICLHTPVTFTATETNTGGNPVTYQWKKNGVTVAVNSNSYIDSVLVNGDKITCQLSGVPCASPAVSTSNTITMQVVTPVTPNIAIATPSLTVCSGASATFTSSLANAGTSPTYLWFKNGVSTSNTGTTYTSNSFVSGDVISCVLSIASGCFTKTTDTSNSITLSVQQAVVPAVVINASKTTICSNETVVFTSTNTNGGNSPSYLWYKNGASTGFSGYPYSTSSIADGDAFSVRITSNALCASPPQVTSPAVNITVVSVPTPTITQNGSTLSSSSASGNQWYVNGTPIAGATAQDYVPVQEGNYTVVITGGANCNSQPSNFIPFVINGVEPLMNGSVLVYPNPATTRLFIETNSAIEVFGIKVFDVSGSVVRCNMLPNTNYIDVSSFSEGVYVVEVKTNLGNMIKRWVKL